MKNFPLKNRYNKIRKNEMICHVAAKSKTDNQRYARASMFVFD